MSHSSDWGIWHDVSLSVNQANKIIFGSGTKVIVKSREFQIFFTFSFFNYALAIKSHVMAFHSIVI